MFFIIGPLRTGSSLLSRCLDDHPGAVCFCESEINAVLMKPYVLELHFLRMQAHGFAYPETVKLLNRRKQDSVQSMLEWYRDTASAAKTKWGKEDAKLEGDKSPDFYREPKLVKTLVDEHRLIYSIRDPRAIFRSIVRSVNSSVRDMHVRWGAFRSNVEVWEPYLEHESNLVVRYEDLVQSPESTMRTVYGHVGLEYSDRFLQPFVRACPARFHWEANIDRKTGIGNEFAPEKIHTWQNDLTKEELDFVNQDAYARRVIERFGYEKS